jgi:HEAT repeat protein
MSDTEKMVQHYIAKLDDSNDDDDAFHRLLELGPSVLPSIREAFRASSSRAVRHRLAEIVRHARSAEALPFLSDLLDDDNAEIWKTALDGLVSLGWEQVRGATSNPGRSSSQARGRSIGTARMDRRSDGPNVVAR